MDRFPHEGDDAEKRLLQECIRFHGHLCPGLVIGFKAALVLLRSLDIGRDSDEELFAIVETDACGSDAIQVVTGCTFGKGNFLFLNYGKHAFSLGSRDQGRAFRACLRSGVHAFNPDQLALVAKIQIKTATRADEESFLAARTAASYRLLALEDNELLTIGEVAATPPPKARIQSSEPCSRCGEPVRHDLLLNAGGLKICSSCKDRG